MSAQTAALVSVLNIHTLSDSEKVRVPSFSAYITRGGNLGTRTFCFLFVQSLVSFFKLKRNPRTDRLMNIQSAAGLTCGNKNY